MNLELQNQLHLEHKQSFWLPQLNIDGCNIGEIGEDIQTLLDIFLHLL